MAGLLAHTGHQVETALLMLVSRLKSTRPLTPLAVRNLSNMNVAGHAVIRILEMFHILSYVLKRIF